MKDRIFFKANNELPGTSTCVGDITIKVFVEMENIIITISHIY